MKAPNDSEPHALDYAAEEPSRRLAHESLAFGILGLTLGVIACPVVLSLTGLVAGLIGLHKMNREPRRYAGRSRAKLGIVLSLVGLTIVPAFQYWILWRIEAAKRDMQCMVNLNSLGNAIYVYSSDDPDAALPSDPQQLIASGLAVAMQFQCPHAPAGRQSYYYVPGRTIDSAIDDVLMFEDPRNHGGDGGHVLYVDGHVAFVRMPEYQSIVDQFAGQAR